MAKQIIAVIVLLEGLVMAALAVVFYMRKASKLANCDRFPAEVVDVVETPGEDAPFRHPVVRYKAMSGEEVTFQSHYGRPHWKVKPGDRLEVAVSRHDPEDAEIVSLMSLWSFPIGFSIMAAISIFAGLVIYLV